MRVFVLVAALTLAALLVACNSQEGTRRAGNTAPRPQTPQTAPPQTGTLETARRITAAELHKLWQKDEVLIVDTRNEPSYKQGHIRGAILIPHSEFPSRADELPKSKMIVTYCT